jgi:Fe-S oxidoreductase
MLPLTQKIAFLLFAIVTVLIGFRGFYRLYLRIAAGRDDTDMRLDRLPSRVWYALTTTLMQSRTFRKRPVISLFHSFIFYGFVFYIFMNFIDGLEGFFPISISSTNWTGSVYNLLADILSVLVVVGVIALVIRRFFLPSRRDFCFNEKTMLHEDIRHQYITRDSIIVSVFILFHVGSRAVGAGAKLTGEGPDRFQPFATLLSHAFTPANAEAWRIFGYWGALGSVLLFLMYFPFSKHLHLLMTPAKYMVARNSSSGVLPALELNLELEEQKLGANKLEDLSWPRLLDAYACIQCNRCQDVCPASVTGKSLSPAALEINKRMELNRLAKNMPGFEAGAESPRPLLSFALSPEAAWACTTCGACMEVCPVQNEQMLDIIDIRRNQVMVEGHFPTQLQSAFRGMERTNNPWGINHEHRLSWAEGMDVRTIDENPNPDVLYWVGCAASYDPQSQKTARAFVQLLTRAGVNFAVLGKKECCTGDSARRAGNEYLYRQLADQNIATLTAVRPKLIVATCPHCMNTIGKEYRQLGGDFKVMHHTEYLESLMAEGKLAAEAMPSAVTYHDPCYLGRHSGVYDAPRNVLRVLTNDFVELERKRENSFCCGAGGAQFWKEEEAGTERISDNRYREVQQRLESHGENKVLAVGCPFCKSMLESTPGNGEKDGIVVKDIAELLLESILRKSGESVVQTSVVAPLATQLEGPSSPAVTAVSYVPAKSGEPQIAANVSSALPPQEASKAPSPVSGRKKWAPKISTIPAQFPQPEEPTASTDTLEAISTAPIANVECPEALGNSLDEKSDSGQTPERKKWDPKRSAKNPQSHE